MEKFQVKKTQTKSGLDQKKAKGQIYHYFRVYKPFLEKYLNTAFLKA